MALFKDDPLGRPSFQDLYEKGKMSEWDYNLETLSGGTLLMFSQYWDQFPRLKESTELYESSYTPRNHRNVNGKIINIQKQRENEIKLAKKKSKCPYMRVYDKSTHSWHIVPNRNRTRSL